MYKALVRMSLRDATVFELVAAFVTGSALLTVLNQFAYQVFVADSTYNLPMTQFKSSCLVLVVSAGVLVGLLTLRLRRVE